MGAYRCCQPLCSTVPLFTSSYVSQSLCSPTLRSQAPMFPSPFLPQRGMPYILLPSPYVFRCLSSPIPIFPRSGFPSLWSQRYSSAPMLPSSYIPQTFCSTGPVFPRTVSSPYVPRRCSPLFMLSSPNVSLKLLSSPIVHQWYSPIPLFPGPAPSPSIPQNGFPAPMLLRIFPVPICPSQTLSFPEVFYSSYVPQRCPNSRCSPNPIFPRIVLPFAMFPKYNSQFLHVPQFHSSKNFLEPTYSPKMLSRSNGHSHIYIHLKFFAVHTFPNFVSQSTQVP